MPPVGPVATPCPYGYAGTAPNCSVITNNNGTFAVSATAPSTIVIPPAGGYSGSIALPTGSVATTGTIATSVSTQNGHVLQGALKRSPRAAKQLVMPTAQTNTAMFYFSLATAADVNFTSIPGFTFNLPTASAGPFYLAVYASGDGWQTLEQGTVSGNAVTFAAVPNQAAEFDSEPIYFALYTGGVLPTPAPTATPSPSYTEANFTCPTSDAPSASGGGGSRIAQRIAPIRSSNRQQYASGLLAVSYTTSFVRANSASIVSRDTALGARSIRELSFDRLGTTTRIVSVNANDIQAAAEGLRSQSGVQSVSRVGMRYATSVNAGYFPNDPYFNGFSTTLPPQTGATPPPPTYRVPPYYASANVPGQWDMHAIGLEHAFAYSQSGNGSGHTNAGALGSNDVKIAIVDTGEDTTHLELSGSKVVRQRCFITDENQNQSTSDFTTDPQGHGTDVSGIAAANMNNGLGFVGAGGNASLMAYRVFPSPDTTCDNENPSGDDTCGASTADIASAINDAVANGANVISMSLGGGGCTNGVDSDSVENAAVQNAIAHNVIVVAASGNDNPGTSGSVDAPACGNGVIAVGATSLDDGQPNGRGSAVGTAGSPIEYVASYSQFGTPGSAYGSSSAWGIVAPGGDPTGGGDADDLHWIENIWTSTPADATFSETNVIPQVCSGDYPADTGSTDCRIDIAGTSMATPHVAGAAALILSANSSYQSPAAMKQLLCSTADDLNKTANNGAQGCGRLNVYRAMAKAVGDNNLP